MSEPGEIALLEFEHLPQAVMDNIADGRNKSILDVIKTLSLDKSVPIMMQVILDATPQEVADYYNISIQAVYKKNKSFIKILNAYKDY